MNEHPCLLLRAAWRAAWDATWFIAIAVALTAAASFCVALFVYLPQAAPPAWRGLVLVTEILFLCWLVIFMVLTAANVAESEEDSRE